MKYEIQFRTRSSTGDKEWHSHDRNIQLMGNNQKVVVKSNDLDELKESIKMCHRLGSGMVDNRIIEILYDTTGKW